MINNLPNDVILDIFNFVLAGRNETIEINRFFDVGKLASVCKQWRDLLETNWSRFLPIAWEVIPTQEGEAKAHIKRAFKSGMNQNFFRSMGVTDFSIESLKTSKNFEKCIRTYANQKYPVIFPSFKKGYLQGLLISWALFTGFSPVWVKNLSEDESLTTEMRKRALLFAEKFLALIDTQ